MTLKILNLYAGIGGNRKLWTGDIEVTAVEIEPKIAKIYQNFFPDDKVIIADAHQFLLEHFKEFDFIWSSPPCPSHSRIRKCYVGINNDGQNDPIFPDMTLYQEIIFLQGYFKGKFVIENVIAWYKPLIEPQESGNHWFWANFNIGKLPNKSREHYGSIDDLQGLKKFDLSNTHGIDKRIILRNCVEPKLGLHIFNMAFKDKQKTLKAII